MRSAVVAIIVFFLANQLSAQHTIDTIKAQSFDSIPTITGAIAPPKIFKEELLQLSNNPTNANRQLDELLATESALHLRQYGPGQLTSISMRGTNAAQTNIFWNGVLLNSPMLGQADLSIIPLVGVDEAAIRYGYANQRDGFGGLGGSVLLSSTHNQTPLSLTTTVGSYDDYRAGLTSNYSVGKVKLKSVAVIQRAENNFQFSNISKPEYPTESRAHNAFSQYSFQQHAWWKSRNKALWSLHGLYTFTDREIPAVISSSTVSEQVQEDQTALLTIAYDQSIAKWQLHAQTAYRFMELLYKDPLADVHSNSTMHGLQNNVYAKRFIGKRNKLEFNALLNADMVFASTYTGKTRWQTRLGGQWTRYIGEHWQAYIGAQPEWIDDTLIYALPVVGVTRALLGDRILIKANVARNLRYPTLNDLYWNPGGDEDLLPELGWNAELGVAFNTTISGWELKAEATAFAGVIDDWILWVPQENGLSEVRNVNKVEQRGFEWSNAIHKSWRHWKTGFNLNYTWVAVTDQNDNQLIYTPSHELNYNLLIGYKQWYSNVTYHYTGERYIDTDNSWILPEYDLVDIRIGRIWQWKSDWNGTIQLGVNNVLDKAYMSLAGRPMPGRTVELTLQISRL